MSFDNMKSTKMTLLGENIIDKNLNTVQFILFIVESDNEQHQYNLVRFESVSQKYEFCRKYMYIKRLIAEAVNRTYENDMNMSELHQWGRKI